jgi:hypothetical protein
MQYVDRVRKRAKAVLAAYLRQKRNRPSIVHKLPNSVGLAHIKALNQSGLNKLSILFDALAEVGDDLLPLVREERA